MSSIASLHLEFNSICCFLMLELNMPYRLDLVNERERVSKRRREGGSNREIDV